jgi:hypothetical protein
LLVAGGQDAGQPIFELVRLLATDPGTPFDVPTPEQRYAPVIATDAQHTQAWVGFGETAADGSGTLLATSWLLRNCTSTCTSITPGPTVAMPRRDVAVVAHQVGAMGTSGALYETLVIGGDSDAMSTPTPTRRIDRITLDPMTGVSIGTFGQLANLGGLGAVGAAEMSAGVFLVAGGVDDHGMAQPAIEICFPAALEPITLAATM